MESRISVCRACVAKRRGVKSRIAIPHTCGNLDHLALAARRCTIQPVKTEGLSKVIFVGLHNKGDKLPLCPSTKSGKLIGRIINEVFPIRCFKTNLYDMSKMPDNGDNWELANGWHDRVDVGEGDVIVLLGAHVHKNFIQKDCKVIKIAHPSSMWSHEDMDSYVAGAAEKIITALKS